jgi:hypothetical protein
MERAFAHLHWNSGSIRGAMGMKILALMCIALLACALYFCSYEAAKWINDNSNDKVQQILDEIEGK